MRFRFWTWNQIVNFWLCYCIKSLITNLNKLLVFSLYLHYKTRKNIFLQNNSINNCGGCLKITITIGLLNLLFMILKLMIELFKMTNWLLNSIWQLESSVIILKGDVLRKWPNVPKFKLYSECPDQSLK